METILKVGDKAKGFKFANETDGVGWVAEMTEHIGQEGEILHIGLDYFNIDFGDTIWTYPIELMHLAVVEEVKELPLKTGDKAKGFRFESGTDNVAWTKSMGKYTGKVGVVEEIYDDFFIIEFEDDYCRYPTSLMHLAVVEEEQPKVIEIDVRDIEKIEVYDDNNNTWNKQYWLLNKYRFTFKTESKLAIQKEIKELENRIKELKSKL